MTTRRLGPAHQLAPLIVVAVLAIGCTGPTTPVVAPITSPPPAAVEPTVITQGTDFVLRSSGGPLALRGVNVHPAADAAGIAALGANFVRVYVKWSDIEPVAPVDGVHSWAVDALAALDTLIADLGSHGIQALIDFHQCGWSDYWAETTRCSAGIPAWYYADGRFPADQSANAAKAAWWTIEADRSHAAYLPFVQMMVGRYRSQPNVVGYEVFNEPSPGRLGPAATSTDAILSWQAPVVHAIRALDPWRAIVVMCRGGGEGVGTADLSLLGPDPHLVLDWHDYFSGVPGTGLDVTGDDWVPDWPSTHLQATDTYVGTADAQRAVLHVPVDKARSLGIPLLVGEWGIRSDDPNLAEYQSTMLGLFAQAGVSWARWGYDPGSALTIRDPDGGLNAAGRQLQSYFAQAGAFSVSP